MFGIQLDEHKCLKLLTVVYVRYINDGDFKDEFPFCKPLETTMCSSLILEELKISYEKVHGVCTDDFPAL